MDLELTGDFIHNDESGYIGWIREIKGVVARGETLNEVKNELNKVLRTKLQLENSKTEKVTVSYKK